MGCTPSSHDSNPSESTVCGLEACLHFESQTANQHFYTIRRYTQKSPYLNSTAFQDAAKSMKIRVSNVPACPKLEEFYSSLKNPEVKGRDLTVLAVLLSSGSERDKAQILFEAYKTGFERTLSKATIEEMVSDLVEMSTARLEVLVPSGKAEVTEYLEALAKVKSEVQREWVEAVVRGKTEVSQEELEQELRGREAQALLSSQKVRKVMYSRLPAKPA